MQNKLYKDTSKRKSQIFAKKVSCLRLQNK